MRAFNFTTKTRKSDFVKAFPPDTTNKNYIQAKQCTTFSFYINIE